MKIKNKVREIIKNKSSLYVIARFINDINNPDFVRLIKGYFEESYDYTSILMIHNGEKYPNEIVYYIASFLLNNKKNYQRSTVGFCAMLRRLLEMLNFSDFFGWTPVVEWGITSTYYDPEMDEITRNVFEYYFDPISNIDYRDINNCKNVIRAHTGHGNFFMEHATSYRESYEIVQNEIERLGYIYKKYICLNSDTNKYIENSLDLILNKGTILAVHARGTDFNIGIKDHPKEVTANEYLIRARSLYASGQYNWIFLATEDENILQLFRQEFKDRLLYYSDVFRTQNHVGPHGTHNDRPLHYYKLGLEVLRDVYTLANCNALLCGLSQVSFAAQYVNIALNRRFDEVVVLNNGMN